MPTMYALKEIRAINARSPRTGQVAQCSFLGNRSTGIVLHAPQLQATGHIRDPKACDEFLAAHRKLRTDAARNQHIISYLP